MLETVWPLDAERWMGWEQIDPTTVYVLAEGAEPRLWDHLWGLPAAPARGRDRVLWAGRDFVAVGAADGSGAIENHDRPGAWDLVRGNDVGFVISDWSTVLFSVDGVNWTPATGLPLDADHAILDLQASADRFALLLRQRLKADGVAYSAGVVMTSSNGIDWENTLTTEIVMGREPEVSELRFVDGRWWATGPGTAYTSVDGIAWRDAAWKDAPRPEAEPTVASGGGTWAEGEQGWRHVSLDDEGRLQVRTVEEVLHPPAPDAETLLAQWAELATRIHAQADLPGFYRELAALVELLGKSGNAELAQAARDGAMRLVVKRADAEGLRLLQRLWSAPDFQKAKTLVEAGAVVLRKTAPERLRRERSPRGTAPSGDQLDPVRMRRNLLEGVHGAAYDLAVGYGNGYGMPRDPDFTAFWVEVVQQLVPGTTDIDGPASREKLVAAGSGMAASNVLGSYSVARGERSLSPPQWALVELAAAAGVRNAASVLEKRSSWLVDTAHLPEPQWPAEAAREWDEATTASNRVRFERHVAFARDLMAYRATLTPGAEPDRAAWATLVARHAALLEDPEANALFPFVLRRALAVGPMMTSDDAMDASWRVHMTNLKQAMAVMVTSVESWLFRARMLQWSGQLAEARRDATVASLLAELPVAKRVRFHELLAERARGLELELNLPVAVLVAPQQSYPSYNLEVAKSHAFTGQLTDEDSALVERLYANLGARLWVTWRLPDPAEAAQAEADLYSIFQFEAGRLPYPGKRLEEWRRLATEYRALFPTQPEEAMELMEELVVDAAHPDVLFQRALMLGRLRGPAEERAALERLQAGFPHWKLTAVQHRLGQLRGEERDETTAASQASYVEALALLNRGETAAGRAKLVEACATPWAVLPALQLLAELEGQDGKLAKAEEHLQQGFSVYPRDAAAGARLAMWMISQQRLDDASQVLIKMSLMTPDAPEYLAVKRLHRGLVAMRNVPSTAAEEAQAVVRRMDELKQGPFVPEVWGISAQFRMVLGDRAGAVQDLIAMAEGRAFTPPQVWWEIAQALVGSGDVRGAQPYAEKAAQRGSEAAKVWLAQLPAP